MNNSNRECHGSLSSFTVHSFRYSSENFGLCHAHKCTVAILQFPCFFSYFQWNLDFPWLLLFLLLHYPSPSTPPQESVRLLSTRDWSSLVQVLKSYEIPVANWCTPNSVIWCKDCPLTTTGVKGRGGFFFAPPLSVHVIRPPLLLLAVQTTFWLYIRTCYQKRGIRKKRVNSLSFIIEFPCMRGSLPFAVAWRAVIPLNLFICHAAGLTQCRVSAFSLLSPWCWNKNYWAIR